MHLRVPQGECHGGKCFAAARRYGQREEPLSCIGMPEYSRADTVAQPIQLAPLRKSGKMRIQPGGKCVDRRIMALRLAARVAPVRIHKARKQHLRVGVHRLR